MYPAEHAVVHPDRPTFIMAGSGETVTYREFEERSNRLAHVLRANGIEQYGHYSIYMENHPRFMEACGAGERIGAFYTAPHTTKPLIGPLGKTTTTVWSGRTRVNNHNSGSESSNCSR